MATFVEECEDIVHQVCTETQVHVQTHANVIGHAVAAPAVVNALPAAVAAPAVVNALPAGVAAPGLLSSALGINGASLPAGVVPAGPQLLAHHLRKREADAEADADADADAQFLGLNTLPIAPLATGPAPVALAAAPVAPVAVSAPVAVAPQCQQQVERKCRQVPVQSSRTIAVPRCVAVPKCVKVPHCVAVPKCVTVPHCVAVPKCTAVPKCVTVPHCVAVPKCVPVPQCVAVPRTHCKAITRQCVLGT